MTEKINSSLWPNCRFVNNSYHLDLISCNWTKAVLERNVLWFKTRMFVLSLTRAYFNLWYSTSSYVWIPVIIVSCEQMYNDWQSSSSIWIPVIITACKQIYTHWQATSYSLVITIFVSKCIQISNLLLLEFSFESFLTNFQLP